MADYTQTPHRPNIKPTGLPPTAPPIYTPEPRGWGMAPALGAVAVVGIVALVAWGVINNGPVDMQGQTVPTATQTAPDPAPAAPAVTPDATVTPDASVTPDPVVEPAPVPQEVPEPAPEAAPVPAPTPVPAPSN
jgi:hypothetical protein